MRGDIGSGSFREAAGVNDRFLVRVQNLDLGVYGQTRFEVRSGHFNLAVRPCSLEDIRILPSKGHRTIAA